MDRSVLSAEHIRHLVSSWESEKRKSKQPLSSEQKKDFSIQADHIVRKAVEYFIERTRRNPRELKQYPTSIERQMEYQFLRICDAFRVELGINELTDRILSSEFVSLYYLFVSGELDSMYESLKLSCEDVELVSEIDAKVRLAQQFLEKINSRGLESKFLAALPELPTVGFEFEYINILKKIVDRISNYKEAIECLEGCAEWDKEKSGYLFNYIENTIGISNIYEKFSSKEELLNFLNKEISECISFFQIEVDGRQTLQLRKRMLQQLGFIDSIPNMWRRNGLEAKSRKERKFYEDRVRERVITEGVKDVITSSPSRQAYLEMLGVHTDKPEAGNGVGEVMSKERGSLPGALREIILLHKAGMQLGSMRPQETIGGVEVSRENPGFMRIIPILAAAGYLKTDSDLVTDMMDLAETGDDEGKFTLDLSEAEIRKQYFAALRGEEHIHPVILGVIQYYLENNLREKHIKSIRVPGKSSEPAYLVFPLTHPKESMFLPEDLYDPKNGWQIELRFFPEIDFQDPKDFILFVKTSSFVWLSGWAKCAHEMLKKNEIMRESQKSRALKLSQAWKVLIQEWDELIQSRGLRVLGDEELYYVSNSSIFNWKPSTFIKFTNTVILWADEEEREKRQLQSKNETLRSGARRIIREFQAKVKPFLTKEYLDSLEEERVI